MPKQQGQIKENYQMEIPTDNKNYKIIILILSIIVVIIISLIVFILISNKNNETATANKGIENESKISSLEKETATLNQKVADLELKLKNQAEGKLNDQSHLVYENDYYSIEYIGMHSPQKNDDNKKIIQSDVFDFIAPGQTKDSDVYNGIHMSVQVTDLKNQDSKDVIKESVGSAVAKNITISNKEGFIYGVQGPMGPDSWKEIFVIDGGKLYNIGYSYLDTSNLGLEDAVKKILESFKIK